MTADLTLPGTIPGLLRRGSPVVVAGLPASPREGLVVEVRANADCDTLTAVAGHGAFWWPAANLSLDLTDATGRAHAAWWAASREFPSARHEEARFFSTGIGWWLTCGHAQHPVGWTNTDLGLDPADPRLLPDGSRWVDAEALRLVVLHVAGVPS